MFCPVLDIDIPDTIYKLTSQENDTWMQEIELQRIRVFYFNAFIGDWEPFIENLEAKILVNSVKN